jgi:hypothetical protein
MIDTEIYIHLTRDMYPELIEMDQTVTSSISKVISRAITIENKNENKNESVKK